MSNQHFTIRWFDRGAPPKVRPDPAFPEGKDLDISDGAPMACTVALPYPSGHVNVGMWMVTCTLCGYRAAITAASRPDDARSVKIPCSKVERH